LMRGHFGLSAPSKAAQVKMLNTECYWKFETLIKKNEEYCMTEGENHNNILFLSIGPRYRNLIEYYV
jgi:hypothetical protein